MNLYWVVTPDNYENWFIVAKTKRLAEKYHESAEGFGENYAKANLICEIPIDLIKKYKITPGENIWPDHNLITELGGKLISTENPRIVNFFGKVYREGTFSEGIFFDEIKVTTGVYVIKVQNTDRYKIGITKNIKQRIKQFETGNPFNLKLLFFIATQHYKSLEKLLHNIYKYYRITGEWFAFDADTLKDLEYVLNYISIKSNEFQLYDIQKVSKQGRVFE